MTPEQTELARQLAAHPKFTLAPGMGFVTGNGDPWRFIESGKDEDGRRIHRVAGCLMDTWQSARKRYVGASEIGALFDVEIPEQDYLSRFALWHFKRGSLDAPKSNKYLRAGNRLERVVFETFREELELDCRIWADCDPSALTLPEGVTMVPTFGDNGEIRTLLVDEARRMSVTLDGLEYDADGLLVNEAKTCNGRVWRNWALAFEDIHGAPPEPGDPNVLPASYLLQLTQGMALSGIHRGRFLVLVDGVEPHPFRLDFRPEVWAAMTERAAEFWCQVESGVEPDPNCGRGGDQSAIERLFGRTSRPVAEDRSDDERLHGLLRDRIAATKTKAAAEAELDRLNAEIKHAIGDVERVTCRGVNVTSTMTAPTYAIPVGEADVGKFVAGFVSADETGAHVARRGFRALRVTEPKPKKEKAG